MAFTGNMHKLGQAGTGSNEDSFIAMFLHEFRNGENFADDHVRIKFDAQFLQFSTWEATMDFGRRNSGMP